MSEPARFERAIAIVAGLVLAATTLSWVRAGGWPWGLFAMPPLLMGGGAAAVAVARGPRASRVARLAVELSLVAGAALYALVGILFVLPAIIVAIAAAGFFGFETAGPAETRSARIVIAIGALWTLAFGPPVYFGRVGGRAHVALAASVALVLAGAAWLRALRHAQRSDLVPRAVARP